MSESNDYDPGPWTGYSFTSARASYDAHAGRSYDVAVSKRVSNSDLIEKKVSSLSAAPVVIACDVTGSMGEWPAVIFSKLPYLDLEGKTYFGGDMEVSFAAVGDQFSDKYPLQVRKFCIGKEMEANLKELVIEGGGGGSSLESYDLAALYYARNCDMPNAVNPIMIFIGDEGLYDVVTPNGALLCEQDAKKDIPIEQVFEELKQKFSVYLVRKPYGSQGDSSDSRIQAQWEKLLGADHVCILPEAGRVVDVIFGIFAKETGKIDYFTKEIEDRQTKDQVNTVMKSLVSVHKIGGHKSLKKLAGPKGASITRRSKDDDSLPVSRSLLD